MLINNHLSNVITNDIRTSEKNYNKVANTLSTGLRINSASDDSSGLSIAERMTAIGRGKSASIRNIQDGLSFLQTTDSVISSMVDMYQRIRELAVQADNGTYSAKDRSSIQKEVKSLLDQIDNLAENTTFNGIKVFKSDDNDLVLHVDETSKGTMDIRMYDLTTAGVGIDWISVETGAQYAIAAVDSVISQISDMRADYGAYMNRLQFKLDNLNDSSIQNSSSKSRIEDIDMSAAMSDLTKSELKFNTANSILTKNFQYQKTAMQLLMQ